MAKRPGKSTTREVDKDDIRRFSSFGDFVAALVADKVVKSKDDLVLNHPELLSPILFDWYRQGQVACLFAMRIAKTPADHRWESAVVQGPPDPNALEPILLAAATTVNAIQLIFPGDGTASQTVSLINALCEHPSWTCHEIPWIPIGLVAWKDLWQLRHENEFEKHEEAVKQYGFWLFAKSVKVGASKHVRVRPRFEQWSCGGTISVVDDTITESVLGQILEMAGTYCGLGDWRPSSPSKPGPFGRFTTKVRAV